MIKPKPLEIGLVRFPFSDLTATKLRPALILSVPREEFIILGIFSKVPTDDLSETWVLMLDTHTDFIKTGLKKTSLIRADKTATVHNSVFHKKLGILTSDLFNQVEVALKKSLNIT